MTIQVKNPWFWATHLRKPPDLAGTSKGVEDAPSMVPQRIEVNQDLFGLEFLQF
jgi:hypothetical protein